MIIDTRVLLSRGQAARLLLRSPERVAQLGRSGRLTAVDTPAGRMYLIAEVEQLALEMQSHPQRRGRPVAQTTPQL